MADWKSDDAEGVASSALIMFAPELCPAMVILDAEPPKLGMTFCKKRSAFIVSITALFVAPVGPMKPNCGAVSVLLRAREIESRDLQLPDGTE